ncbi:hypothetical protein LshimejAT787_2300710 [Lyophyllum shimeji]|uniref:Uncharacterized protein n=1 Tax=Lyophyllum shimeji TaxID=47721 RepID=A0A9P3Q2K2_LYOSH|nr:hypothetical protein LshimejAT787_2300710 [Lyophyllum shimeji]
MTPEQGSQISLASQEQFIKCCIQYASIATVYYDHILKNFRSNPLDVARKIQVLYAVPCNVPPLLFKSSQECFLVTLVSCGWTFVGSRTQLGHLGIRSQMYVCVIAGPSDATLVSILMCLLELEARCAVLLWRIRFTSSAMILNFVAKPGSFMISSIPQRVNTSVSVSSLILNAYWL